MWIFLGEHTAVGKKYQAIKIHLIATAVVHVYIFL